jgi:hypothetical protein
MKKLQTESTGWRYRDNAVSCWLLAVSYWPEKCSFHQTLTVVPPSEVNASWLLVVCAWWFVVRGFTRLLVVRGFTFQPPPTNNQPPSPSFAIF